MLNMPNMLDWLDWLVHSESNIPLIRLMDYGVRTLGAPVSVTPFFTGFTTR
jgi:hypothetical protein